MVGCLHLLNGHEFEQASGVGDGQGSLACCSPWGYKKLDVTERLNNNIICHHPVGKKSISSTKCPWWPVWQLFPEVCQQT